MKPDGNVFLSHHTGKNLFVIVHASGRYLNYLSHAREQIIVIFETGRFLVQKLPVQTGANCLSSNSAAITIIDYSLSLKRKILIHLSEQGVEDERYSGRWGKREVAAFMTVDSPSSIRPVSPTTGRERPASIPVQCQDNVSNRWIHAFDVLY